MGDLHTQRKNSTVTSINGYIDSRSVSSAARVRLSSRWRRVDFLKKPIVKGVSIRRVVVEVCSHPISSATR
jgi:hypothetical protein